MQCCTCGAAAEDRAPGDFDGIRIDCRHCGLYEVNGAVLDKLLRLSLSERARALAEAKQLAGQDRIPLIDGQSLERL